MNRIPTAVGPHPSKSGLARVAAALALTLGVAACGGGGSGDSGSGSGGGGNGPGNPPPGEVTLQARIDAATATAQSSRNACAPIQPFYWEVGDASARLGSGSVPSNAGAPTYTGSTVMAIASASKWLYGAYVVQLRQGQLSDEDIKFLTFRSGYTNFARCLPGQTVDGCVAYLNNGVYTAVNDGYFSYGGGHMEKHASLNGLGPLDNAGLAAALRAQLVRRAAVSGLFTTADTLLGPRPAAAAHARPPGAGRRSASAWPPSACRPSRSSCPGAPPVDARTPRAVPGSARRARHWAPAARSIRRLCVPASSPPEPGSGRCGA